MRTWRRTFGAMSFLACLVAFAAGARAEEADPVAHYALDEGRGTTVSDGSAARRHGEIRGAKWVKRDGRVGLQFDGKSAHVACGSVARLAFKRELSVSAWVYPERSAHGKDAVIVGFGPETWALTRYKGAVYFYVSGGGNYAKAEVTAKQWSHVAGTFDGKTLRLYVNGSLRGSRKAKGAPAVTAGEKFFIGAGSKIRDRYQGLVSDVRIHNRALSAAEIGMLALPADSELPRMKLSEKEKAAGTAFFGRTRRKVEFKKSGRQLWLANGKVGFEILQGDRAFYLSRIYGSGPGQDFLIDGSAGDMGGFWRLALRRDEGRDDAGAAVDSTSGAELSSRTERADDAVTLRMLWKNLAVPGEKQAVDAEVLLTVRPGDPLARWRINVANRSKNWGLWRVVFPVIKLRPLGEDASANRFIVSRAKGLRSVAPFRTQFYSPGKYPGAFNMQFSALYDAGGRGLYVATHDGDGYRKLFHNETLPDRKALEYRVEHVPPRMGHAGRDYRMPYDCVIGPFEGDWYDACQVYRAWAVKQRWCAKGPLSVRKDIPRWYKECPIVFKTNMRADDAWAATARDQMLALLEFIGTEMPMIVYTWKEHLPEMTHYNNEASPWRVPEKRAFPCGNIHDGNYPVLPALKTFSSACRAISEAGGRVKPYICAGIFDPGLNENSPLAAEARPNAVRTLDGKLKLAERNVVSWSMCYYTEWWQKRMAETVTALIKREGAGSIYFDTFGGGHVKCFDTRHGHSPPGGNHGYLAARALSEAVRGAMKRADPRSIMSGENPAETAIDLLDGFLYRHTIRPHDLPLFAAVYGDYICRFGIDVKVGADGFYMQCATLFVEGAQIGRMSVGWAKLLDKEHAGTEMEHRMLFLRKLARYYRPESAAKYLAYGRLLRPLAFKTPDPMPSCSYDETYAYQWEVTRPSLMSGVFQAPNGDIGVLIVNISGERLPFSFELTPAKYPIDARKTYRVSSMSEAGERRPAGGLQKGKVAVAGELAGHDVVCFDVQAK